MQDIITSRLSYKTYFLKEVDTRRLNEKAKLVCSGSGSIVMALHIDVSVVQNRIPPYWEVTMVRLMMVPLRKTTVNCSNVNHPTKKVTIIIISVNCAINHIRRNSTTKTNDLLDAAVLLVSKKIRLHS